MNFLKGNISNQSLMSMLINALEKEGECWQSGFFKSTTSSPDPITGAKRDMIVIWMIEKADLFKFNPETWALGVTILDRFLHTVKAQAKYLKCIAITCLSIAAKFSEEDDALLTAEDFVKKSQSGCTASDLVRMERIIISKLQWKLPTATPLEFLHIFHAMMLSSNSRMFLSSSNACQQLVSLTYQLRQCISCHALLCFRPATLALAILSLELEYMGISWLPTVMGFQRLASIDNVSLIQCREKISYQLASTSNFFPSPYSFMSRPVKRKMSESEDSVPGDEDMYDGIKRLYSMDDDYILSAGCGKMGCAVEALSQMVSREVTATVAN